MSNESIPPCGCAGPAPFWCARHSRHKGPQAHALCQRSAAYRALWDSRTPAWSNPMLRVACQLRGEKLHDIECETCSHSTVLMPVHACSIHGQAVFYATDDDMKLEFVQALKRGETPAIWQCDLCSERKAHNFAKLQYFSCAQRVRDTLSLVQRLPRELAAICGVARSGLAPAVELALALHLPLFTLSDSGVLNPGSGYRLSGSHELGPGPILVMDDSRGTGRSQTRAMSVAARHWPDRRLLFACLYFNSHDAALPYPDFWVRELNAFHLFEWNLFNSPFFVDQIGADFDGILSTEWPGNAAGERFAEGDDYEAWLAAAPPLYLPRRDPLSLVATARLEKHRAATEAWLARQGVRVERLAMWPGTAAERWQLVDGVPAVVRFKAEQYAKRRLQLFIESDPQQARQIAQLTGRAVLCPAAERVFA